MPSSSPAIVPLADPVRDVAAYRVDVLAALARVLDSGPFILGAEVMAKADAFLISTQC